MCAELRRAPQVTNRLITCPASNAKRAVCRRAPGEARRCTHSYYRALRQALDHKLALHSYRLPACGLLCARAVPAAKPAANRKYRCCIHVRHSRV